MRKRRVGVTARSRQIVGNQVTGTLQFATEIAAPLELRTPMGTCGEGRNQSANGSMVTMARELTGRMQSEKSGEGKRAGASPLRPRSFRLTGRGHLMEAATVRERWLITWQACAPSRSRLCLGLDGRPLLCRAPQSFQHDPGPW